MHEAIKLMALLEISNLEAFYGKARSLHGVSLNIEPGKIVEQ